MPATQSLIPIVGNIHFDDLTNEFEARASLEIKTPLGIFRKEFRATLGDLASALLWLANLWTGQSLVSGVDTLGYPLGDMTVLGAAVTAFPTLPEDIEVLPVPVVSPEEVTGGDLAPWHGDVDGYALWGVPL